MNIQPCGSPSTFPTSWRRAWLLAAKIQPAPALEAIAIEGYRERRLTGLQLRSLLSIPSRYELDGFLKQHRIEKYTADDFEHDLATLRHDEQGADRPA